MKCPAYIKAKINGRAYHAVRFIELDNEICEWMDKHGIDLCDPRFSDHILMGAESLCNPISSAKYLLQEIEEYGERQNVNEM